MIILTVGQGCTSDEQAQISGVTRDAEALFLDAEPLLDGTVVYRDAGMSLPDVSVCRLGSAAGTVCSPSGDVIPGAVITAETQDCFGGPVTVEVS